jgi:hypothetical protein
MPSTPTQSQAQAQASRRPQKRQASLRSSKRRGANSHKPSKLNQAISQLNAHPKPPDASGQTGAASQSIPVDQLASLVGPATYQLSALAQSDGPTQFSGQVYDHTGKAPNQANSTSPGTTATQYPALHFEALAIRGQSNTLAHPIYLPPILMSEAKIVGGNQDISLKIPGYEGFEVDSISIGRSTTNPYLEPTKTTLKDLFVLEAGVLVGAAWTFSHSPTSQGIPYSYDYKVTLFIKGQVKTLFRVITFLDLQGVLVHQQIKDQLYVWPK